MRILPCIALALLAHPLVAEEAPPPGTRTIHVSGSAEVRVVPDRLLISLGVETRDRLLDQAKRMNDDRVGAILSFLRESRVPERQIQTGHIDIRPRWDERSLSCTNIPSMDPCYYTVRKTVDVTLDPSDQVESILTGVVARGANQVFRMHFYSTELKKHREKARELATRAAREKAEKIATALGARAGRPLSVAETSGGRGYASYSDPWGSLQSIPLQSSYRTEEPEGGDTDGTIAPGEISVSATVDATFELE